MQIFECPLDHQGAAVFFHLQRCIDSFGQLLTSLLGIKLVRVALEPGGHAQARMLISALVSSACITQATAFCGDKEDTREMFVTDMSTFAGEAWADDIQKVTLVNEEEGLLGTIYLDLHPR